MCNALCENGALLPGCVLVRTHGRRISRSTRRIACHVEATERFRDRVARTRVAAVYNADEQRLRGQQRTCFVLTELRSRLHTRLHATFARARAYSRLQPNGRNKSDERLIVSLPTKVGATCRRAIARSGWKQSSKQRCSLKQRCPRQRAAVASTLRVACIDALAMTRALFVGGVPLLLATTAAHNRVILIR